MGAQPDTWDTRTATRSLRWPASWRVTAAIGRVCRGAAAALVAMGHTDGKAVDGPISAAYGALIALLSLGYLASGRRHVAALATLVVLWLCLAWLGSYGADVHAEAAAAGPADPPAAAPLLVLGALGIAGAGAVIVGGRAREGRPHQEAS